MKSVAGYWDSAAPTYDDEPDHGLRDPGVEAAWARRLRSWMPALPIDVVEFGCGTGSLSLVLAKQGHAVTAVDISPAMVQRARAKLVSMGAEALVGDAADPPLAPESYDVVLARHVVWTLPDPHKALRRWVRLIRPGGHLVLVEGRWDTSPGAYAEGTESMPWIEGVAADRLTEAVRPLTEHQRVEPLTDPALWGRPIHDERYALIADV